MVFLAQHFTAKRQQRNVPGALDRDGHCSLVLCARASLAARADLAIFCNETTQQLCVLVVYFDFFVRAELANPRPGKATAERAPLSGLS